MWLFTRFSLLLLKIFFLIITIIFIIVIVWIDHRTFHFIVSVAHDLAGTFTEISFHFFCLFVNLAILVFFVRVGELLVIYIDTLNYLVLQIGTCIVLLIIWIKRKIAEKDGIKQLLFLIFVASLGSIGKVIIYQTKLSFPDINLLTLTLHFRFDFDGNHRNFGMIEGFHVYVVAAV